MKKSIFWQIFVVVCFCLVCVDLFFLSKEVIYHTPDKGNNYTATLEIRLCYRTWIEQEYCHTLEQPEEKTAKQNLPTACQLEKLEKRLGCYTKGWQKKPVKDILDLFRGCNIGTWARVQNETNGKTTEPDLLLFEGQVCAVHKFEVNEKRNASQFSISSDQNTQPFDVYVSYTRDYANDGRYKSKTKHLMERVCWVNADESEKKEDQKKEDQKKENQKEKKENQKKKVSYNCTETGKKMVFEIDLYFAKHLPKPFKTNCVYRTDSNDQAILQQDYYERCVKKETKYHLLTYDAGDDFSLHYGKTADLKQLLDDCADECHQEDCQAASVHVDDHYEEDANEKGHGEIILSLSSENHLTEAVPLIGTVKLLWMITSLILIFFGVNFFRVVIQSANLDRLYSLAAIGAKRKRQNKKRFNVTITVQLVALLMALILEKLLFDFGRENRMTFLRKDSIEERSVSVSICFSICEILKNDELLNECTDEKLAQKWTVKQLDAWTWNASDFKQRTSMKNSARHYPIRQDEFPIPHFFRDLKKCFLIHYDSKNYWPHYSLQRYSRLFINISGDVRFAHFFIEDGHHHPAIGAKPTKTSVLHWVSLESGRPRDGCVHYPATFGESRDELIRQCVIAKSVDRERSIPAEVTLRLDDPYFTSKYEEYSSLKFNSPDPDLFQELFKVCEKKNEKPACIRNRTSLTHQNLWEEDSHTITINLTPFLYETRPFDDEHGLIVTNRVLSFLLIFTGFSVREFFNALVSVHLFDLFSFYDRSSRLLYPGIASLFLLHFCLLFHSIIYHPMLDFSYSLHAAEIESTKFRVCLATKIPLDFNNYTLEDLNKKSLNYTDIFESLLIYDDDNRRAVQMMADDFSIETFSKYPRISPVWNGSNAGYQVMISDVYMNDLKCFTMTLHGNKTKRNLNVHYQRLQKLYAFTYSFAKLNRTSETYTDKLHIFFTKPFAFDLDWDRSFIAGDYAFEYHILLRNYQDDYFFLKNLYSFTKSLLGPSKPYDKFVDYLESLRNDFIKEQYATTSLMPLYPNDTKGLPIKNRQFNYYIQFRSIATERNSYDFTENTDKIVLGYSVYKRVHQPDKITLKLKASLVKFQENMRNRYRPVELFLHLVLLTAFWFRVDLVSLPSSLASAYPIVKYILAFLLYCIVLALLALYRVAFAFGRFLKFKND